MNIVDRIISPNIWDEEWEVGSIDNSTGQNVGNSNIIRSKNYISVIPNTTYYFYCGNATPYWNIYFYDKNNNFISRIAHPRNTTFNTPNNCVFIRFRENDIQYGTTYNHNICINESNPSINGKYFPYVMYKRYDIVDLYRKWNQFVRNGNFNGSTYWSPSNNVTFSVDNNEATVISSRRYFGLNNNTTKAVIANHVYFFIITAYSDNVNRLIIYSSGRPLINNIDITNIKQKYYVINRAVYDGNGIEISPNAEGGGTFKISNVNLINLTDIYGAGNEPTTYEEFIADYPEFESYVESGSGEWQGLIGSNANIIKRLKIGG